MHKDEAKEAPRLSSFQRDMTSNSDFVTLHIVTHFGESLKTNLIINHTYIFQAIL